MNERDERELSGADRPLRLLDLPTPPAAVFVRGELPRGPSVAVVGTRTPSEAGLAFTRELVTDLVGAGVAVLSGGARGIDAAAHSAALDAGGTTVVVAPSGFDAPYPPEHADLFERVLLQRGAYVSLVPRHVKPTRGGFHARNATLVALAHAVVVVQARTVSGARSAARAARRLGRAVFVVPAAPWDELGHGCLAELERGARPLRSAASVLRFLTAQRLHGVASVSELPTGSVPPPTQRSTRTEGSASLPLPFAGHEERGILLDLLRSGADHPDVLAARTGWSVPRIQQVLLTLTLDGVVVSDPTGRLILTK